MEWFKRHLNFTYLLGLTVALLSAFLGGMIVAMSIPEIDESDPSYGLRIYLDSNYSSEWSGSNIPDLGILSQTASTDGWYESTLTVYLENTGELPLIVYASATENPQLAIPGFSATSDKHILSPKDRQPMVLHLSQIYWYEENPIIYFQIDPSISIESAEGNAEIVGMIATSIVLLFVSAWVLRQKGRSYGWLLLSLSFIGPIVILCLSNKQEIGTSPED